MAGLPIAACLSSYATTGTPLGLLQRYDGHRVLLSPPEIAIEEPPAGNIVLCSFELRNLTGSAIQVTGAQRTCGCLTLKGLPMTVPARTAAALAAEIRLSDPLKEDFAVSFDLALDTPSKACVGRVNIRCGRRRAPQPGSEDAPRAASSSKGLALPARR